MTISLKIEILKVFSLEFNLSSDQKKKEEESVQEADDDSALPNILK